MDAAQKKAHQPTIKKLEAELKKAREEAQKKAMAAEAAAQKLHEKQHRGRKGKKTVHPTKESAEKTSQEIAPHKGLEAERNKASNKKDRRPLEPGRTKQPTIHQKETTRA